MNNTKLKKQKKEVRRNRVRAKISGTKARPRLSVFRSNKEVFLQLIDDEAGVTMVSVSSKEIKSKKNEKKIDAALAAGKLLAEKAKAQKIEEAVFDRAGYKYHGRVKAVADGARAGGLKF